MFNPGIGPQLRSFWMTLSLQHHHPDILSLPAISYHAFSLCVGPHSAIPIDMTEHLTDAIPSSNNSFGFYIPLLVFFGFRLHQLIILMLPCLPSLVSIPSTNRSFVFIFPCLGSLVSVLRDTLTVITDEMNTDIPQTIIRDLTSHRTGVFYVISDTMANKYFQRFQACLVAFLCTTWSCDIKKYIVIALPMK
jgi:hypothetical protein